MAHNRQLAMLNIGAQKSPLADVVMQLYLWSHTQTKEHWRKELRAIVKNCKRNVIIKKGRLKKKDIVESLDNIAEQNLLDTDYRSMQKDLDYVSLKTKRTGPPTDKQMHHLIETLAKGCLSDVDDWEVADLLITQIESW